MKHGRFKQNSRGLWLAMAAAVLLVAPGAEYGISQQSTSTPQEPANLLKQPIWLPLGGTVVSDLGVVGQVIIEQTPAVQKAIRVTRVYDVSDLIERFVADHAVNKEDAPRLLENMLACYETQPIPQPVIANSTAVPTAPPAPPFSSSKRDGEFSLRNGQFSATTSEANHELINNRLARFREFGFRTLDCSVEVFCGPDELSLDGLK